MLTLWPVRPATKSRTNEHKLVSYGSFFSPQSWVEFFFKRRLLENRLKQTVIRQLSAQTCLSLMSAAVPCKTLSLGIEYQYDVFKIID